MSLLPLTRSLRPNLNETTGFPDEEIPATTSMERNINGTEYAERLFLPNSTRILNMESFRTAEISDAYHHSNSNPRVKPQEGACTTSSQGGPGPHLHFPTFAHTQFNNEPALQPTTPQQIEEGLRGPLDREAEVRIIEPSTVWRDEMMPICHCARTSPNSFLTPGQGFEGTQNVSQNLRYNFTDRGKVDAWRVNVRLQGCDLEEGYICGIMEALNVPSAKSAVVTFWEGEIIDNVNHTFFTKPSWGADRATDIKHWSKFIGFDSLKDKVVSELGEVCPFSMLSLLSLVLFIFLPLMSWRC
mmetsp:Transcript_16941/g.23397  ORF Transcript_16941/g.23397 Transcript_16941/m.23397 type:complete len:300 (+) Transcript_16941:256-1155(+)